MSFQAYNVDNVDFSKLSLSSPFVKNDVTILTICHNKREPFLVKLPSLFTETIVNDPSANLILKMIGKREQPMNNVTNFLNALDKWVVDELKKKSKVLKLKNVTYKSLLQVVSKQDVILKFALIDTPDFSTKIFSDDKELVDKPFYSDHINGNCFVKSLLEFNSLVIRNNEVVLYVRPHQLKVSYEKIDITVINELILSDTDDEDNLIAQSEVEE